jgi:hypothetical protein
VEWKGKERSTNRKAAGDAVQQASTSLAEVRVHLVAGGYAFFVGVLGEVVFAAEVLDCVGFEGEVCCCGFRSWLELGRAGQLWIRGTGEVQAGSTSEHGRRDLEVIGAAADELRRVDMWLVGYSGEARWQGKGRWHTLTKRLSPSTEYCNFTAWQ